MFLLWSISLWTSKTLSDFPTVFVIGISSTKKNKARHVVPVKKCATSGNKLTFRIWTLFSTSRITSFNYWCKCRYTTLIMKICFEQINITNIIPGKQVLLISINFTPKTGRSFLKRMVHYVFQVCFLEYLTKKDQDVVGFNQLLFFFFNVSSF